jgi:hypothetical protein
MIFKVKGVCELKSRLTQPRQAGSTTCTRSPTKCLGAVVVGVAAFSSGFCGLSWFRQSVVVSSRLAVDWRSRVETHQWVPLSPSRDLRQGTTQSPEGDDVANRSTHLFGMLLALCSASATRFVSEHTKTLHIFCTAAKCLDKLSKGPYA